MRNPSEKYAARRVLRYELDTGKGKTISAAESGASRWDSVAIFNVGSIINNEAGLPHCHQAKEVDSRGSNAEIKVPELLGCQASRYHRVTHDQLLLGGSLHAQFPCTMHLLQFVRRRR